MTGLFYLFYYFHLKRHYRPIISRVMNSKYISTNFAYSVCLSLSFLFFSFDLWKISPYSQIKMRIASKLNHSIRNNKNKYLLIPSFKTENISLYSKTCMLDYLKRFELFRKKENRKYGEYFHSYPRKNTFISWKYWKNIKLDLRMFQLWIKKKVKDVKKLHYFRT